MRIWTTSTAAALLVAGLAGHGMAQQSPPAPSTTPSPSQKAPAATPAPMAKPVKGLVIQQSEGTLLSTELVGASVKVGDQAKAGSVIDLVFTKDGKIEAVVLGVGGFLGLGSRNVAIKYEDVTIAMEGGKPTVQVSAQKIDIEKAAPFKTLADMQAEKDAEKARQERPAPGQAPRPTAPR